MKMPIVVRSALAAVALAALMKLYVFSPPMAWVFLTALGVVVIRRIRVGLSRPLPKGSLVTLLVILCAASPVAAQTAEELPRLVHVEVQVEVSGPTPNDYRQVIRADARGLDGTGPSIGPSTFDASSAPHPPFGTSAALAPVLDSSESREGQSYDPDSGNICHTQQASDGSITIRGINARTGTVWYRTIASDGSQTGMNAAGDLWQYDARSQTYVNLGRGQICRGEGVSRSCTK